MIFGSCLGTVTSLTSHEDDIADNHVGPGGDGEGVALLYRSICLIWMSLTCPLQSTPTTSAEPLQIKAKDLPGTELEVCLKFAFFISQEVFFSVM